MKPLFEQFHEAILTENAESAISALKTNARISPQRQMAIYIKGYRTRLIHAVRTDYPALFNYLGENAFDALALAYTKAHPPTHFNLDRYPHGFSAFVSDNSQDGFARDLATLEGAIAEVFMQEESAPFLAESLAHLSPEAFGQLVLKPRTASRLLALGYRVNDWLTAERAGEKPPTPLPQKTYLYIHRHLHNVQRTELSAPAFKLLQQLLSGLCVAKTLENVPDEAAADVQGWFAGWLAQGFFAQS